MVVCAVSMKVKSTFKCLNCNEILSCEPRNRGRQRFCPAPACRRASKAQSQRQWLRCPDNENYFRGAVNVARVREWRKAHPGYWRPRSPKPGVALQEPSNEAQEPQSIEHELVVAFKTSGALQEICLPLQDSSLLQPALLVGLISVMTGHALHVDIAGCLRSMLERGEDILRMDPARQLRASFDSAAAMSPALTVPLVHHGRAAVLGGPACPMESHLPTHPRRRPHSTIS